MLNENIMKKGTELAEGALIYGQPIEDLTIEELRAVAALGWNAYMQQTIRTQNPFD